MRKGQAAMEFLMTYGWAILVVLIAIGALAYFGVLNPARFLPNSCTLFPGLACTEFKVNSATAATLPNTVQLFIRNGIGDSVQVTGTSLTAGGCAAVDTPASIGVVPALPYTIGDGVQGWVNYTGCTTQGALSSRFKADITITYNLGTAGLSHTRTGAMVAQVE